MKLSLTEIFPKSMHDAPLVRPHGDGHDEIELLLAGAKPLGALFNDLPKAIISAIEDNKLCAKSINYTIPNRDIGIHAFISKQHPTIKTALQDTATLEQYRNVPPIFQDVPGSIKKELDRLESDLKFAYDLNAQLYEKIKTFQKLTPDESKELSGQGITVPILKADIRSIHIDLVKQGKLSHTIIHTEPVPYEDSDKEINQLAQELCDNLDQFNMEHIRRSYSEESTTKQIHIVAQPQYAEHIEPAMKILYSVSVEERPFTTEEIRSIGRHLGYLPQDVQLFLGENTDLIKPVKDALVNSFEERRSARIQYMYEQGNEYPQIVKNSYEIFDEKIKAPNGP